MISVVIQVVVGASLVLLAFWLVRALNRAGTTGPDGPLPPRGGRVPTVRMKVLPKGEALTSEGLETTGGAVYVSPRELRLDGGAAQGTFALDRIEAVHVRAEGDMRAIVLDLADDDTARAVWMKDAVAQTFLEYLRTRDVPLDPSATDAGEP